MLIYGLWLEIALAGVVLLACHAFRRHIKRRRMRWIALTIGNMTLACGITEFISLACLGSPWGLGAGVAATIWALFWRLVDSTPVDAVEVTETPGGGGRAS